MAGSEGPELFIGLAAPIGTDLNCIQDEITSNLASFGYSTVEIRVSSIIDSILSYKSAQSRLDLPANETSMRRKIAAGNAIRKFSECSDILARAVCANIRGTRFEIRSDRLSPEELKSITSEQKFDMESKPRKSTAYIIRQLKRHEEVKLLRKVYGPHFVLISATSSEKRRLDYLKNEIGKADRGLSPRDRDDAARSLMAEDSEQDDKKYGQLISETFPLADFFLDATERANVVHEVQRFFRAFFGSNRVSPTRDEYGSYFAKAASLKTVDLSRQVGAAIFTEAGEIVSMGCNDVAKAGGGHFWEEDSAKHRDIDIGSEANKEETSRIIFDFVRTLEKQKALAPGSTVEELLSSASIREAISESMIGEITEYGRMIHAEMSAITDAVRLGRPVKGTTLFVTTYPCHNCAKHIIASGVRRVVYIEPYPKSRATLLYSHAISDSGGDDAVAFEHFFGISPRIYKNIFEKEGKRRDKNGRILEWVKECPAPLISEQDYDLIEAEVVEEFTKLLKRLE